MHIKKRNNKYQLLLYYKLLKYFFSYSLGSIQMVLHIDAYNNTNSVYKNVTN